MLKVASVIMLKVSLCTIGLAILGAVELLAEAGSHSSSHPDLMTNCNGEVREESSGLTLQMESCGPDLATPPATDRDIRDKYLSIVGGD